MWGLSSARISSLHNSVYLNPPKTACGYPCGRVTKKIKNGHSCKPLTLWNVLVSVQLHVPGGTQCFQLRKTVTHANLWLKGMYWSVYTYIHQVIPSVFSWGKRSHMQTSNTRECIGQCTLTYTRWHQVSSAEENGHTCEPLILGNAFVSVQLHIPDDTQSVQMRNVRYNNKNINNSSLRFRSKQTKTRDYSLVKTGYHRTIVPRS